MSQRSWTLLAVLLALAVGGLLVSGTLVGQDPATSGAETLRSSGGGRPSLEGRGTTPEAAPRVEPGPPPPVGSPAWLRGLDRSDAAAVLAAVEILLAREPVAWGPIAELAGHLPVPLPEPVRGLLLAAIRTGDPGVQRVFVALEDGSLASDLLAILAAGDHETGARQGLLQALALLPAADPALVVEGLEGQLTGDWPRDNDLLHAIALRGGLRAAAALLAYLETSPSPQQVAALLYALSGDTRAALDGLLPEALARPQRTEVLRALIQVAGRAGADAVVPALRALDVDTEDASLRREVVHALARIGSADAIRHVLQRALEDTGPRSDGVRALARISHAGPEARDVLREAWQAGEAPAPLRAAILDAFAGMRDAEAAPWMAGALEDPEPEVRRAALRGLGHLGESARAHTGRVGGLWQGGDLETRHGVVSALAAIGGAEARQLLEGFRREPALSEDLMRLLDSAIQMAAAR